MCVKGQVREQVFLVVRQSSRLEMVNGKKTEEELSPAFHSLPTETTEPPSPFTSASVVFPSSAFHEREASSAWEATILLPRGLPDQLDQRYRRSLFSSPHLFLLNSLILKRRGGRGSYQAAS